MAMDLKSIVPLPLYLGDGMLLPDLRNEGIPAGDRLIIATARQDEEQVEASIREACKDLPPASWPRSISFVDTIDTNNMKLSRR